MPLDTYANLQASILSWLARPGDPLVSPAVPDMIQLFEREATRRLKVGGAEKRVSLTALSAAVALPADFGELRLATSGGVILTYVTPMQLPDGGGPPAHYTIIGNEMRLGPSPSGGCTVEIVYQSGVPPLSDTNTSNWLLTAHPDCYLFGSLVEAESFIGSDERVPLWAQRREAAFASIETADRKARWGGAPLSIRAEGVARGNGGGTAAGDWTAAPPVSGSAYVSKTGDTMTGALYVPVLSVAAAKVYVDAGGINVGSGQSNQTAAPGNTLTVTNQYSGPPNLAGNSNAAFARLDYQPTGNDASNSAGVYGIIWADAPHTFTGSLGAVKGNAYVMAQLSATVASPGNGNAVGDTLTIVGGTCTANLNTPPTFTVSAIGAAGAVTAVTYDKGTGACDPYPANPVTTTSSRAGAVPPALNLTVASSPTVNVLDGVYGRVRNQSKGTITDAAAIFADGAWNTGGGIITNAYALYCYPPYTTSTPPANSYGVYFAGDFPQGEISAAPGVNISINAQGSGAVGLSSSAGTIDFSTAGSLRGRVATNGALGWGPGATSSWIFNVIASGGLSGPGGYLAAFQNTHVTALDTGVVIGVGAAGADTLSSLVTFYDGALGAVQGAIQRNGAAAVAYGTTSDERLKQDIEPTAVGLAALLQVPVRDFAFVAEPGVRHQGLVAQELFEIYPEAVSVGRETADGISDSVPWMIDYGRLTPLLIRAVQELAAKVAALEGAAAPAPP